MPSLSTTSSVNGSNPETDSNESSIVSQTTATESTNTLERLVDSTYTRVENPVNNASNNTTAIPVSTTESSSRIMLGFCHTCRRQNQINIIDFTCLSCNSGFVELIDPINSLSSFENDRNRDMTTTVPLVTSIDAGPVRSMNREQRHTLSNPARLFFDSTTTTDRDDGLASIMNILLRNAYNDDTVSQRNSSTTSARNAGSSAESRSSNSTNSFFENSNSANLEEPRGNSSNRSWTRTLDSASTSFDRIGENLFLRSSDDRRSMRNRISRLGLPLLGQHLVGSGYNTRSSSRQTNARTRTPTDLSEPSYDPSDDTQLFRSIETQALPSIVSRVLTSGEPVTNSALYRYITRRNANLINQNAQSTSTLANQHESRLNNETVTPAQSAQSREAPESRLNDATRNPYLFERSSRIPVSRSGNGSERESSNSFFSSRATTTSTSNADSRSSDNRRSRSSSFRSSTRTQPAQFHINIIDDDVNFFNDHGALFITTLLNELRNSHRGPAPASTSQMEALPDAIIDQETFDKNLQCAVCMDDFILNETTKKLPCKHLFHNPCIIPWLKLHATCPVCRQNIGCQEAAGSSTLGEGTSGLNGFTSGGLLSGRNLHEIFRPTFNMTQHNSNPDDGLATRHSMFNSRLRSRITERSPYDLRGRTASNNRSTDATASGEPLPTSSSSSSSLSTSTSSSSSSSSSFNTFLSSYPSLYRIRIRQHMPTSTASSNRISSEHEIHQDSRPFSHQNIDESRPGARLRSSLFYPRNSSSNETNNNGDLSSSNFIRTSTNSIIRDGVLMRLTRLDGLFNPAQQSSSSADTLHSTSDNSAPAFNTRSSSNNNTSERSSSSNLMHRHLTSRNRAYLADFRQRHTRRNLTHSRSLNDNAELLRVSLNSDQMSSTLNRSNSSSISYPNPISNASVSISTGQSANNDSGSFRSVFAPTISSISFRFGVRPVSPLHSRPQPPPPPSATSSSSMNLLLSNSSQQPDVIEIDTDSSLSSSSSSSLPRSVNNNNGLSMNPSLVITIDGDDDDDENEDESSTLTTSTVHTPNELTPATTTPSLATTTSNSRPVIILSTNNNTSGITDTTTDSETNRADLLDSLNTTDNEQSNGLFIASDAGILFGEDVTTSGDDDNDDISFDRIVNHPDISSDNGDNDDDDDDDDDNNNPFNRFFQLNSPGLFTRSRSRRSPDHLDSNRSEIAPAPVNAILQPVSTTAAIRRSLEESSDDLIDTFTNTSAPKRRRIEPTNSRDSL